MIIGHLRKTRQHRYQPVCQGDTLEEAHAKLCKIATERGITDSLCRRLAPAGSVLEEDAAYYKPE